VAKKTTFINAAKTQKRILLIDNYDSFTYNLYDYVAQCGAACTVVRNDMTEEATIFEGSWDGVLLSPGPKTPQAAGKLMLFLAFFIKKQIPILGVCLGHEAIGQYFGASLVLAPQPRHGKTSPIQHSENGIFKQIKTPTDVMRYHSLVLESLENTPLIATAHSTDDGCIMALEHPDLPIWGVQFHPESILTKDGLLMIANWLELI
jgi:anthranilate synthase/aminodeoxychorismate synthase-like glutamine amidotransferase